MYTITQGPVWTTTDKNRYATLLSHENVTPMMLAMIRIGYDVKTNVLQYVNCTNMVDDQAVLNFIATFLSQGLNGGILQVDSTLIDRVITLLQDQELSWTFQAKLVATSGTTKATFTTQLVKTVVLANLPDNLTLTLTN